MDVLERFAQSLPFLRGACPEAVELLVDLRDALSAERGRAARVARMLDTYRDGTGTWSIFNIGNYLRAPICAASKSAVRAALLKRGGAR